MKKFTRLFIIILAAVMCFTNVFAFSDADNTQIDSIVGIGIFDLPESYFRDTAIYFSLEQYGLSPELAELARTSDYSLELMAILKEAFIKNGLTIPTIPLSASPMQALVAGEYDKRFGPGFPTNAAEYTEFWKGVYANPYIISLAAVTEQDACNKLFGVTVSTSTANVRTGHLMYAEYYTNSSGYHKGFDAAYTADAKIYAISSGKVVKVEKPTSNATLSILVIEDTAKNIATIYMHGKFTVNNGDTITVGQQIGTQSDYGAPGSSHVHFQVESRKTTVNSYGDGYATPMGSTTTKNPYSYVKQYLNPCDHVYSTSYTSAQGSGFTVYRYKCTKCSSFKQADHAHSYSSSWSSDASYHWKQCNTTTSGTTCMDRTQIGIHTPNSAGVCTSCGYNGPIIAPSLNSSITD